MYSLFLIQEQLIYNVVSNEMLVSNIQQSDSAIHIYSSSGSFPLLLQHIEQSSRCHTVSPCCLFYIQQCVYLPSKLPRFPSPPFLFGNDKTVFYVCRSFCFVQFSSVTQSCLTLCVPMNRSMPGLPVPQQLQESTQTHVH